MRSLDRVIYLPDFDIDHNGNLGSLAAGANAESSLLVYVLFYDQVRLQSSAFGKAGGMFDICRSRPELFWGVQGDALVSMGLRLLSSFTKAIRKVDIQNSSLRFWHRLQRWAAVQAPCG